MNNPYVESAFRTLKYRPELPVKPFENLLAARRWVTELAHWYNNEYRHSAMPAWALPCLKSARSFMNGHARQILNAGQGRSAGGRMSMSFTSTPRRHK